MNMNMYRCICRFLKECVLLIRVALPAEDIGADGLLSDCTERLTPLAHSVFVLALSYTGLMTLLCHRSMLRIGTSVVVLILWHRCTWCKLILVAHLDAPRIVAVIRVMLDVASAEVRFQPETAPAVCSQRTRLDDAPDPWVGSGFGLLLKKWKKIDFAIDFWPIWYRFLMKNFWNSIGTPLVFNKEWP